MSKVIERFRLHLDGASVLRQICEPVRRSQLASVSPLLREMARMLTMHKGQGLAAPQLGVSLRLFVLAPERRNGRPLVVLNPRVLRTSRAQGVDWEACLSVPGHGALVERPQSVEVAFDTLSGTTVECVLRGDRARAFQHECDHLEGVHCLWRGRLQPHRWCGKVLVVRPRHVLGSAGRHHIRRVCVMRRGGLRARMVHRRLLLVHRGHVQQPDNGRYWVHRVPGGRVQCADQEHICLHRVRGGHVR